MTYLQGKEQIIDVVSGLISLLAGTLCHDDLGRHGAVRDEDEGVL